MADFPDGTIPDFRYYLDNCDYWNYNIDETMANRWKARQGYMASQTIFCKQCGTEIVAAKAISGDFCSFQCSVMHSLALAVSRADNAEIPAEPTQPELPKTEVAVAKPDSISGRIKAAKQHGEEWLRAAQTFEQMAQRYSVVEQKNTGKRSIIIVLSPLSSVL